MTRRIVAPCLAAAICLFHIIPFFVLINISFKVPSDMSSRWSPPSYIYVGNFVNAWNNVHLGRAFANTALITAASVTLIVVSGSMAAYPLARFPTRWNTSVYTLFVSIMVVPPLAILVPLYRLVKDLGAMSTYQGIILVETTFWLPLAIFFFSGFIKTIPRELDEAALMDGCSRYGAFFRVVFPLLKPVTATVIILVGTIIWNDFTFSLLFLQKQAMQTTPLALAQFFGQYEFSIGQAAAGCLMAMLPATLAYLFLQRCFISGMTEGAVKG
jgi:raffinose/stachyose/melibiose transport system permease protein